MTPSRCPRCGRTADAQVVDGVRYLQCTWGCDMTAETTVTNDPVEDAIELRRSMRYEEMDPLEPTGRPNDPI